MLQLPKPKQEPTGSEVFSGARRPSPAWAVLHRAGAGLAVALPWGLACGHSPARALLWVFGAVVSELWLGLLGGDERTASYTTLLGACGALLGLALPWLLLLFLLPLFFVECGTLTEEARLHARRGSWENQVAHTLSGRAGGG